MSSPPTVSDTNLNRLNDFLSSEAVPETAMDVSTLEGILTALAIGPRLVLPSTWLPWMWDFEHGQEEVVYADRAQAQEVMGLAMDLVNRIAYAFQHEPESIEPVFFRGAQWGAAEWCKGFLKATQIFDTEDWAVDALRDITNTEHGCLITSLLRLGDGDGFEITKREGNAQRCVGAIVLSVVAIHTHWLARRSAAPAVAFRAPARRDAPKVGRNDPYPCGSGRKFKKCCGDASTLH
jgi:uncharacterized protein